ncbi:MAG: gamma-glutamylcyclotransferase [Calothrix sp. C42_A2020_038]|nr:gamma-glutamylcyclotransferase [Calothrix sp. C42_A2020_038]
MINVFVYGTLKPGEENYSQYCADKVIDTKPAFAMGKLYALPQGYPAMTLGNNPVWGYMLSFPDSTVLVELDQLEDYQPSRHSSENLYNRRYINIFIQDNTNITPKRPQRVGQVWAYLMEESLIEQLGGTLQVDGLWSGCKN